MDRRDQGEAAATGNKTGPSALLPDDVLADVLRRLPPRGLAASRCVCKSWLAVVDARRLLRADLLPLSLGGLFINFKGSCFSEFFARPFSDGACVSGKHDYLPQAGTSSWRSVDDPCNSWRCVDDHCNGLVLIYEYDDDFEEIGYVLNPATGWLARVPPCPPQRMEIKDNYQVQYLVYDPFESPYFEVVSFTNFYSSTDAVDEETEQGPPLVCILHVFSSRTGQSEERSFARQGQGDSMGAVSGMRHWPSKQRNAVYWRGVLYVHCQTGYVMRISLPSDKYHVIKPPPGIDVEDYPELYLGKSSNGVYCVCASIKGGSRVQVWNLDESGCQMKWVLKHDRDLSKWLLKHKLEYGPRGDYGRNIQGPWTLQDINYYYDNGNRDHDMEAPVEEKIEWASQESEDEEFTWSSDDELGFDGGLEILGFHPYKEIIFLSEAITRGLAYHLNSSKVEVLGNIFPTGYDENQLLNEQLLDSSFPYTPCWLTQTAEDQE